jgi:hypothetical protein
MYIQHEGSAFDKGFWVLGRLNCKSDILAAYIESHYVDPSCMDSVYGLDRCKRILVYGVGGLLYMQFAFQRSISRKLMLSYLQSSCDLNSTHQPYHCLLSSSARPHLDPSCTSYFLIDDALRSVITLDPTFSSTGNVIIDLLLSSVFFAFSSLTRLARIAAYSFYSTHVSPHPLQSRTRGVDIPQHPLRPQLTDA